MTTIYTSFSRHLSWLTTTRGDWMGSAGWLCSQSRSPHLWVRVVVVFIRRWSRRVLEEMCKDKWLLIRKVIAAAVSQSTREWWMVASFRAAELEMAGIRDTSMGRRSLLSATWLHTFCKAVVETWRGVDAAALCIVGGYLTCICRSFSPSFTRACYLTLEMWKVSASEVNKRDRCGVKWRWVALLSWIMVGCCWLVGW